MAANVQKLDIVDIELNSGTIHRSWIKQSIGSADVKGNAFGVRVFRDGEPVTLSSVSVYGYFRDPHGTNIAITSGNSVSGNVAYVVLPAACYNYEGQFCLAIKLIGGGITGTVRIVDGMVDNTNTGSAVAPTSAVPSYSEILSTYDAMVAATAVANAAIAPTYENLTFPVYKGQLCIYNGGLYKAKQTISSSEVWTSSHWEATTFGDEMQGTDMLIQNDIATIYNEALPYDAGKIVIKDGVTYLLPNGHTAGTAWASTTKTIINLSDHFAGEVSELKSAIDDTKSAIDNFPEEIRSGNDEIILQFKNGWINGSGVYDSTSGKYLSNVMRTNGIKNVVNNSGYALYIVYFSAYSSLTSYTFATYTQVNDGKYAVIDSTYAYFAIESNQTDTAPLANIKLYQNTSKLDYISNESIKQLKTGSYKSSLKQTTLLLLGNYSIGDVVDITPIYTSPTTVAGTGYVALITGIIPGEKFSLYAVNGSTARPWAFLDADYKLLSMANTAYAENVEITAPATAAYMIVQVGTSYYSDAYIIRQSSMAHLDNRINDVRDLADDKMSDEEIRNGYNRVELRFKNGWINGSGVYDPQNSKFLSNVVSTAKANCVINDSGSALYIIYFSAYNSLDSFTYASNTLVDTGKMAYVSKTYPYCAIASNQTSASPLSKITLLEEKNLIDYLSKRSIEQIRTGSYKANLKQTNSVALSGYSIGDVVDISPLYTTGTVYTAMITDIIPGEKFTINATNGTSARPWAFLDADYKLLSMADGAYAQNVDIVAPANAEYLLIQVGSSYYSDAFITRHYSIEYATNDDKQTGINDLNGKNEIRNIFENACNVATNDTSTAVKSRENLLTLLHFSDIHGSTSNIRRILEFADAHEDYIFDIIHTGDSVTTYYGQDNPFAAVGGSRILNVIGNHDCWKEGATWPTPYNATAEEAYNKFISPYISNWNVESAGEDLCYYFKDYATNGFRVVVLDSVHWDADQLSWFEGVLEDAKTNGLAVVTIDHYPAQNGLTGFNCTFNAKDTQLSPETQGTNQMERLPDNAFDAVDDFIEAGGDFVCWIVGHTHEDYVGVVQQHTNQIQIVISCGLTSNKYSECARTTGTKSQDLFNFFTADKDAKLIKIVRIGADTDKYLRSKKTLCINYETKQIISNN